MAKTILFLFTLLALGTNSPGQGSSWKRVLPDPPPVHFSDIQFTDSLHGWAVGEDATLCRTVDGGSTWEVRPPLVLPSQTMSSLHFLDRDTGWAAGPGHMFATVDGGDTWAEQAIPASSTVNSYAFPRRSRGFAVGSPNLFLRSLDGGKSWERQPGVSIRNPLKVIRFTDSLDGWAGGDYGTLLRTRDGGTTWDSVAFPRTNFIGILSFPKADTGWIVADNGIARTRDGGSSWDTLPLPPDCACIGGMVFWDAKKGWASGCALDGPGGHVWETTDAGETWKAMDTGKTTGIYAMSAGRDGPAWFAGVGSIYKTPDRGKTWITQSKGSLLDLYSVHFTDPRNGWAVGMGSTVIRTTDGGATWSPAAGIPPADYVSAIFLDGMTGWIGGYDLAGPVLGKTEDGGKSWTVKPTTARGSIAVLRFIDRNTGFFISGFSEIYRTLDGGATWAPMNDPTNQTYRTCFFVSPDTGWVVVNAPGALYKTTDGGRNWTLQLNREGQSTDIDDMFFLDSRLGWIVGTGGICLRTRDGGATWERQITGVGSDGLYSVAFADSLHGAIAGAHGALLGTEDGGATWVRQIDRDAYTGYDLQSVQLLDSLNGWVAGSRGTLLAMRSQGPLAIRPAVPGRFARKRDSKGDLPAKAFSHARIRFVDARGKLRSASSEGLRNAGARGAPEKPGAGSAVLFPSAVPDSP
jgi:photosystem II stability/assembly factor-like uncharacterized protein